MQLRGTVKTKVCLVSGAVVTDTVELGPVWAPGRNLPLIRFMISHYYVQYMCVYDDRSSGDGG